MEITPTENENTNSNKNESRLTNTIKYQNVNYKSDTDYAVIVARTLLTPLGIYPLHGSDTSLSKFLIAIQIIIVFGLMLFLLVPHFIWTFFDAEDLKKLMKIIAAQIFNSLALIKFWTMIIHKKELRNCLIQLENNWKNVLCEEDRVIMMKNAKIGRFFTIAYLSLSYGGALPYHILLPLTAERIVKEDNSTQIPLPYPTDYVFFVPEDSPGYEMLFVTHIVISTMILSTNCGIYSLIATYIMHACCLFEVVCRHLDEFSKSGTKNNFKTELTWIVENHNRAIQLKFYTFSVYLKFYYEH